MPKAMFYLLEGDYKGLGLGLKGFSSLPLQTSQFIDKGHHVAQAHPRS